MVVRLSLPCVVQSAAYVDAHHLTFVGRASMKIGDGLHLVGNGIGSLRKRFLRWSRMDEHLFRSRHAQWTIGCRTHRNSSFADDVVFYAIPDCNSNGRPVIGGTTCELL